MRSALVTALMLGVLVAPACADSPDVPALPLPAPTTAPPLPDLQRWGELLGKYFTENDIRMIFDYLGESTLSALRGEETPMPPELVLKLEILKKRLEKEGAASTDALLKWLDQELQRSLKQLQPLPKSEKTGALPLPKGFYWPL